MCKGSQLLKCQFWWKLNILNQKQQTNQQEFNQKQETLHLWRSRSFFSKQYENSAA